MTPQELADTNFGMDPDRANEALRESGARRWRIYAHYLLASSSGERDPRSNSRR